MAHPQFCHCSDCSAVMASNSTAHGMGAMPQAPEPAPFVDWPAFLATEHLPDNFNSNGFIDGLMPNPYQPEINYAGVDTDQTWDDSSYMTELPVPPAYSSQPSVPPMDSQASFATPPFHHPSHTGQKSVPHTQEQPPVPTNPSSTQPAMATLVYAPTKHISAARSKGKRPFTNSNAVDAAPQQLRQKQRKLFNAADHLRPTADQDEVLRTKLRQWRRDSHFPTDKELKAIASACDLPLLKVAMWYGANLQVENDPNATMGRPEQASNLDRDHVTMILEYIKDAFNKQCAAGKSKTRGKYRCTWRYCSYSTDKRYEWERHEESKQPQHFWICTECTDKAGKPFMTHRPDKIFPHLDSMHKTPKAAKDEIRVQSKVEFTAPFIRDCHYVLPKNGQVCIHSFTSWKERNDHWIAHYNDEASDSDDDPPANSGANGDGGSESSNGQSGSDSPSNDNGSFSASTPWSKHKGNPSGAWMQHGSGGGPGGGQYGFSLSSGETKSVTAPTRQIVLLDVNENKLVSRDSKERYLALKYDSKPMPSFEQDENATLDIAQETMPPEVEGLSTIMRSAMDLTRDMGFKYLWTEKNEQGPLPTMTRDKHFQSAVLIIVMGYKRNAQQPVWHFTCDYTRLSQVEDWVHKRHWFRHDTALGQGAYGFVDRVTLTKSTSHQPVTDKPLVYARKIILRDRTNRNQRACYMQEIEIMQKLNHRHIAKFEAAYYDRTAFNILMSPVAECDMRHLLSHPEEFESQRSHILRWCMSLAEALAYMHKQSCRHKDIKPANILVSGNDVLLTDFGTAMEWDPEDRSTTAGDALMTPKYCAPEVAAQQDRGRAADVFSLGCVFTEMLTVWFQHSIDEFHQEIQLLDASTKRKGPYHEHIQHIQEWLRKLEQASPTSQERRSLLVTKNMIQYEPLLRPLAHQVTSRLCTKKNCHGLKQDATCHCCPRQPDEASSDLPLDVKTRRPGKPLVHITPSIMLSFNIARGTNGRPQVMLEEHKVSRLRFEPEGKTRTILPDALRALHNPDSGYTHRRVQGGKRSINIHHNSSSVIINATYKTYRRSTKMVRERAFILPPRAPGPATEEALETRLRIEYAQSLQRGKVDAGIVGKDGTSVTSSFVQAPAFDNSQDSLQGRNKRGSESQQPGAATQALEKRLKTEYAMALDRERSRAGSSSSKIEELSQKEVVYRKDDDG